MKIFLTGGTGYLGGSLLEGLLAAGHDVTVFSRRQPANLPAGKVSWHPGDLAKEPPPREVLRRHRAVIHSAAMVTTWARDRSLFDRINVDAWDALLERCSSAGVVRILHTSSFISLGPSPGPDPISEADRSPRERFLTDYERTKYLADQVTDRWARRGLPVVTVYPTILFGPGAVTPGNLVGRMIWMIAKGRFPGLFGSGEQVWNFGYVPDVVAGHVQALQRGLDGRGYILGGSNLTLNDFVAKVHRMVGKPARIRHLGFGVVDLLARGMELGARLTGRTPDLTPGVAQVYRHHWSYDSSLAERDLGYRITPPDDALDATVRWAESLKEWR